MRYRDEGQVHMDFHRTTNGTIAYLRESFGQDFLDETLRRTGQDVYRSIREDLERGDPLQLLEHWVYYFDREQGEYSLCRDENQTRLEVHRCPAIAYLQSRGIAVDPAFCRQTIVINETLAKNSPFTLETQVLGEGRCVQTLRRKA